MYLTKVEVLDLFAKMLKWLRPGGKLYFRESCFHQSGDKARTTNPTQYRDPATYTNYFQSPCIQQEATKGYYAFELIFSKFAQTHIKGSVAGSLAHVRENFFIHSRKRLLLPSKKTDSCNLRIQIAISEFPRKSRDHLWRQFE
ncbi:hypothetical protein CAPTEDRAFT_189079 [Capitella teleta]|uniref:phosphoethanolamine N-methyltransferase n=1 Tax=Capitella teleta TaxID=283909 RepID=R7T6Y0_CAPTE|nr:hypothetical protein CAPTEDRAFT_189079 [Capitella teleta]|eukprot:ELT87125.1 hypothetical protein CAPTEDRAFT_189079 [Capitella teleta]